MYADARTPTGLGFDVSDFFKNLTSTGLNIYNQHMQLKTLKASAAAQPRVVPQPVVVRESAWDMNTVLTIGGIAVGGVILFSLLRRK